MTTITALPTPPSRDDPTNFAARGDAFMAALPTFATECNTVAGEVQTNATTATTQAGIATTQAGLATTNGAAQVALATTQAQAAAASASASAAVSLVTKWISGTTYAQGDCTWSPVDFQTYRRKAAGGGTTDPASDSTNWSRIPIVSGTTPIGGLMAFDNEQTGNTVTTSDGSVYLKTGVIADATTYPDAASSPYVTIATLPRQTTYPNGVTRIRGMAYGAGVFVATAENTGADYDGIIYSQDGGHNWTFVNFDTTLGSAVSFVSALAYGGGKFVVIEYAGRDVFTSTDGINWTRTANAMPVGQNWISVAYGGGRFVAVGGGNAATAYSTDGVTWTAGGALGAGCASDTSTNKQLAYGAGLFVVIRESGGTNCYTSPDGVTWTSRTWTTTCVECCQIIFDGTNFVVATAASSNNMKYSSNGTTWSEVSVTGSSSRSYVWQNGSVLHHTRNLDSAIYKSTNNGQTWAIVGAAGDCFSGWTSAQDITSATDGTRVVVASFSFSYPVMNDGGDYYGQHYQTSLAVTQVAYNAGKYVAGHATTGKRHIYTSKNGTNWYEINIASAASGFSDNAVGVAYFNGAWRVSGASYYTSSTDLKTFTSTALPDGGYGCYLWAKGDKLFACNPGIARTYIRYSTDGTTWNTIATAVDNSSTSPLAVEYGNSTYVLSYPGALSIYYTSSDGITWTQRALPSSETPREIYFYAGYFYAQSTANVFYKSSDAITWTAMTNAYQYHTSFDVSTWAPLDGALFFVGATQAFATDDFTNLYQRSITGTNGITSASYRTSVKTGSVCMSLTSSWAYTITRTTDKVLNDSNVKTYSSTAALQTNFYKRVA